MRIKIKKIMIVFISLILLIPSVCTAAISRHEEDHGCLTYYRIDEKEPGYSVAILLLRDMKLNEWLRMYFSVWVPYTGDSNHLMSKRDNIILHIGNISYNLPNNGYDKVNKYKLTYKSGHIPFDVARTMRNAIGNKSIWYTIPLENGSFFAYTPSRAELNEYAEAYDAYMEEADAIRNNYGY